MMDRVVYKHFIKAGFLIVTLQVINLLKHIIALLRTLMVERPAVWFLSKAFDISRLFQEGLLFKLQTYGIYGSEVTYIIENKKCCTKIFYQPV